MGELMARQQAEAALDALAASLRSSGVRVSAGDVVSVAEIRVGSDRVSVACHAAPSGGPLHICLPGLPPSGACRAVGPADLPAETAAVILRELAAE